jgi:predicted small lipoprotein YifL
MSLPRLALLFLAVSLAACAACGPGNIPGEDSASGGTATEKAPRPQVVGTRDGGMLPCEEDPIGCGNPYPEGPGGTGGTGSGIPVFASFFNDSGATRLFRIYTDTGTTVLPETELRMQQTTSAPKWSYPAGTAPTLHAEVWSHFGVRYGYVSVKLSPTAASVNCTFRYVEWVPGSGGQSFIYPVCN